MAVSSLRHRLPAAVVAAAFVLVGTAACSDDGDDRTVLVLQTFGNFGYEEAIRKFEETHPNLRVDHQRLGELRDYAPQLTQWLSTGSGAGDVVALEEGILLQYVENPDVFHDLFEFGAGELQNLYLPWKWERAITADGRLIGLGTDVGGIAMCYRIDLFEQAGLPTDRDEVTALWPTWDDYVEVGRRFRDSGVEAAWLDSATGVVQPYVMQNADVFFYDRDGTFIGDTNPVFREAWDLGLQMAEEGLTAKLVIWSDEWTAGFRQSQFATRPCPAWMTGLIENWAGPEHAGKWDIAGIPGGSGNWGGSYLAIPRQSKHPQEAYELLKFLTSPDGHLMAFEEIGAMPSSLPALEDPRFTQSTNPYFNGAPVGQIMAASVRGLEPIHLGALHQQTWENIFEPAMQRVEAGSQTSEEAFAEAVAQARALQSQ